MPLRDTTEPTLLGRGDEYVVFIASGTPPWCSDCRDALPVLEKVFTNEADDTILQVVKVGTEEEWKSPDNTWKGGPYRIEEIPCLIKYEDSAEVGRLGVAACRSVPELKDILSATQKTEAQLY